LNITALSAHNSVSVLECWQLSSPFVTSDEPGRVGTQSMSLAQLGNATYDIIPARYDGGLHSEPRKQFVYFISGLAHITLPNHTEAWIRGGKHGLIFAEDTSDVSPWGHGTEYPGQEDTIAITIPVEDGVVPEHTVLHEGPC
ncbi:uncharacterized protein BCR38DRAFT_299111, partial [Pseudomassariella vexata]